MKNLKYNLIIIAIFTMFGIGILYISLKNPPTYYAIEQSIGTNFVRTKVIYKNRIIYDEKKTTDIPLITLKEESEKVFLFLSWYSR